MGAEAEAETGIGLFKSVMAVTQSFTKQILSSDNSSERKKTLAYRGSNVTLRVVDMAKQIFRTALLAAFATVQLPPSVRVKNRLSDQTLLLA